MIYFLFVNKNDNNDDNDDDDMSTMAGILVIQNKGMLLMINHTYILNLWVIMLLLQLIGTVEWNNMNILLPYIDQLH